MILALLLLIMTSKLHHISPFTIVNRFFSLHPHIIINNNNPSQHITVRHLCSSITEKRISRKTVKSRCGSSISSSSIQLSSVEVPQVDYTSIIDNDGSLQYGDYSTIASQISITRLYQDIKKIGIESDSDIDDSNKSNIDDIVWIRGRVCSVRAKGNACFLVIRGGSFYTIQACHFKDKNNPEVSKSIIKYVGAIPLESIVDIQGKLVTADVKSCSQSNVELQIQKVFVVSRAPSTLPFLLEDASRSEKEIEESQSTERPFAGVSQVSRSSS